MLLALLRDAAESAARRAGGDRPAVARGAAAGVRAAETATRAVGVTAGQLASRHLARGGVGARLTAAGARGDRPPGVRKAATLIRTAGSGRDRGRGRWRGARRGAVEVAARGLARSLLAHRGVGAGLAAPDAGRDGPAVLDRAAARVHTVHRAVLVAPGRLAARDLRALRERVRLAAAAARADRPARAGRAPARVLLCERAGAGRSREEQTREGHLLPCGCGGAAPPSKLATAASPG